MRTWEEEVTLTDDEGIRADTTYEGVAKIKPAFEGGIDLRRQCQPVLGRRLGAASSWTPSSRRSAACKPLGHLPRLRGRGLRAG